MKRVLPLIFTATLLAGCSAAGSGAKPLIPDKAIQLTAKTSVSLSNLAAGLA